MADRGLDSPLPRSGSWSEPPGDILEALFEYFQTRDDGMSLLRIASHVNSHWRRAALDVILADTCTSRPPWWKRRLPSLPRTAPHRAPSPVPSDVALGDANDVSGTSGWPDSTRALVGKGPAAAVKTKAQPEGPAASEELQSPELSGGNGKGQGQAAKKRRKRVGRRSKRMPQAAAALAVLRNADGLDENLRILNAAAAAATEHPQAGYAVKQDEQKPGGAATKRGGPVVSPAVPGAGTAACESDGSTEARRRRRRRKAGALGHAGEDAGGEVDSGEDDGGEIEQQGHEKKLRSCVDIGADGRQGEGQVGGSGASGSDGVPGQALGLRGRVWAAIQRFTGRV